MCSLTRYWLFKSIKARVCNENIIAICCVWCRSVIKAQKCPKDAKQRRQFKHSSSNKNYMNRLSKWCTVRHSELLIDATVNANIFTNPIYLLLAVSDEWWDLSKHITQGLSTAALITMTHNKCTLWRGRTRKAPPPLASIIMATNLGLTVQNALSHVTLDTRISS